MSRVCVWCVIQIKVKVFRICFIVLDIFVGGGEWVILIGSNRKNGTKLTAVTFWRSSELVFRQDFNLIACFPCWSQNIFAGMELIIDKFIRVFWNFISWRKVSIRISKDLFVDLSKHLLADVRSWLSTWSSWITWDTCCTWNWLTNLIQQSSWWCTNLTCFIVEIL